MIAAPDSGAGCQTQVGCSAAARASLQSKYVRCAVTRSGQVSADGPRALADTRSLQGAATPTQTWVRLPWRRWCWTRPSQRAPS